jgi:hypothetical protein
MKSYKLYLKGWDSYLSIQLDDDPNPSAMYITDHSLISLPSNGGKIVIRSSEFVALIPANENDRPRVTQL